MLDAELKRLVSRGYASPVEVRRTLARHQGLENRLVAERAQESILKQSLEVVQSLGNRPKDQREKIEQPKILV